VKYSQFDARALRRFDGSHPQAVQHWLVTSAEQELHIDPDYRPTSRERKHYLMQRIEQLTGLDFSRQHFKLVA